MTFTHYLYSLVQHIEKGASRCIICPRRPTRHYLKQCEDVTPHGYLRTLTQEQVEGVTNEPIRRTAQLGAGTLFEEYVTSRQVRGDVEQAQKLQEQLQEEVAVEEHAVRLARKKEEERDLELARRLQLSEVCFKFCFVLWPCTFHPSP